MVGCGSILEVRWVSLISCRLNNDTRCFFWVNILEFYILLIKQGYIYLFEVNWFLKVCKIIVL